MSDYGPYTSLSSLQDISLSWVHFATIGAACAYSFRHILSPYLQLRAQGKDAPDGAPQTRRAMVLVLIWLSIWLTRAIMTVILRTTSMPWVYIYTYALALYISSFVVLLNKLSISKILSTQVEMIQLLRQTDSRSLEKTGGEESQNLVKFVGRVCSATTLVSYIRVIAFFASFPGGGAELYKASFALDAIASFLLFFTAVLSFLRFFSSKDNRTITYSYSKLAYLHWLLIIRHVVDLVVSVSTGYIQWTTLTPDQGFYLEIIEGVFVGWTAVESTLTIYSLFTARTSGLWSVGSQSLNFLDKETLRRK